MLKVLQQLISDMHHIESAYNAHLDKTYSVKISPTFAKINVKGPTRFRRGLQSSAGHTEAQLPRKYN